MYCLSSPQVYSQIIVKLRADLEKVHKLALGLPGHNVPAQDRAKETSSSLERTKETNILSKRAIETSNLLEREKENSSMLERAREARILLERTKETSSLLEREKKNSSFLDRAEEARILLERAKEARILLERTAKEASLLPSSCPPSPHSEAKRPVEIDIASDDEGEQPEGHQLEEEWPVVAAASQTIYTDPREIKERITLLVTVSSTAAATLTAGGPSKLLVKIMSRRRLDAFCARTHTPPSPFYDGSLGLAAMNFKPVAGWSEMVEGGRTWLTLQRPASARNSGIRVLRGTLLAVCRPEVVPGPPNLASAESFSLEENLRVRQLLNRASTHLLGIILCRAGRVSLKCFRVSCLCAFFQTASRLCARFPPPPPQRKFAYS